MKPWVRQRVEKPFPQHPVAPTGYQVPVQVISSGQHLEMSRLTAKLEGVAGFSLSCCDLVAVQTEKCAQAPRAVPGFVEFCLAATARALVHVLQQNSMDMLILEQSIVNGKLHVWQQTQVLDKDSAFAG